MLPLIIHSFPFYYPSLSNDIILLIRGQCLPPSNLVSSHNLAITHNSSGLCWAVPIVSTFALLCSRLLTIVFELQHSAARMPCTLLQTIEEPIPAASSSVGKEAVAYGTALPLVADAISVLAGQPTVNHDFDLGGTARHGCWVI